MRAVEVVDVVVAAAAAAAPTTTMAVTWTVLTSISMAGNMLKCLHIHGLIGRQQIKTVEEAVCGTS